MRTFIFVLLVTLTSICAPAQEARRGENTPEFAAAQGLAVLRALSAEQSKNTGLTATEVERATLGRRLAVMNVELDALRRFKAGDDVAPLLRPSSSAYFPVLLDGSVRSGIRVEDDGRGWEVARVGNSGLATAVDRARRSLPSPDDASVTLIQVLALNLVFVAQRTSEGWQLSPAVDDASVELKVGKVESAATVFARLAPIAARLTGEPT